MTQTPHTGSLPDYVVSSVSVSWEDVAAGNFPPPPETAARRALRTALADVAARAKEALPQHHGRIDQAVKIVLADDLEPGEGGRWTVGSARDAGLRYVIDGECNCPDAARPEVSGWCKHHLAVALLKRVRAQLGAPTTNGPVAPSQETADMPAPTPTIPREFVVEIQGKEFVTYNGLLALAHEAGLVSLSATFVSVTGELALATARATFKDGRTFEESADATPMNVNARIKPHFPRMSLTRAKARVLRDALNINMVSYEEMGG